MKSGKDKNKKEHSAVLANFNTALWHFHIGVPATIANPFITGNNRRVVCTLQKTESFQCALMPDGKGDFFININKKLRDKLGLKEGQSVSYALAPDESEYGLPMPPELEELMKLDDEGSELFHALTAGKQRTLLYMASSPKNSDGRIKKAICILDHLKATGGKINYRQLNELIKNSR